MLWILLLIACIALAYWFLIKPYQYWTKKGVAQLNPLPIVGDNWGTATRQQSFAELVQHVYNAHPETRYTGMYQMLLPTLVIRDPELIKQITVKQFDHFLNHRSFIADDSDPFWTNNLFALKDQRWRDMRATLSPAFTSSKMRQMFKLMVESADDLIQHFLQQNQASVDIEFKDTFTRYSNDVIASVAFGIKCNSLKEPNNEFYLMGRDLTDFGGFIKNLKFLGYFLVPQLYKYVNVQLFSKKVTDFFVNLIKQNIKQREEEGIVRPDMIQLLLDARKNGLKYEEDTTMNEGFATVEESEITKPPPTKWEITDMTITAQALIFFFAGFDAVSNIMCFMAYELGVNPQIQERLRREIDQIAQESDGKLTYEALMRMKYMDMVVSETLRKWPITVAVDRVCNKPFRIQPTETGQKPLQIDVNETIWLPIFGLHRDPKYYPQPDRFDPERFNDQNKHKIDPYTYLPFGAGPRNCIGSRFALLETKVLFFNILRNFEIVPNERTEIPLTISKRSFNLTAANGFWFGLKRRVE